MAIDQAIVGNVAAGLMGDLGNTYGDEASIDTVVLIVGVNRGGKQHTLHYQLSEGAPMYTVLGLLDMAADAVKRSSYGKGGE